MTSSCNETEPAHRRSASTWAQVPTLLKGLIYGPNGRAMSPRQPAGAGGSVATTCPRGDRGWMRHLPGESVSAADVEGGAVLDRVRRENEWDR